MAAGRKRRRKSRPTVRNGEGAFMVRSSIGLDAGGLDDLRPLGDVGANERVELLRSSATGDQAHLGVLLLHLRKGEDTVDLAVEPSDHRLGCSRRGKDREPRI